MQLWLRPTTCLILSATPVKAACERIQLVECSGCASAGSDNSDLRDEVCAETVCEGTPRQPPHQEEKDQG